MYRAVLFDAYVLRPGLSRPAVVSSTHTVYSATNLFRKSLQVFTSLDIMSDFIRSQYKNKPFNIVTSVSDSTAKSFSNTTKS